MQSTTSCQERLALAMKTRGVTPAKLAIRLGVSKSSVSEWLNGGGLTINNLISIAPELNLSIDWLLLGKGSMDLFGPLHPTPHEANLISALKKTGQSTLMSFYSLINSICQPKLGHHSTDQILALELLQATKTPLCIVCQDGYIVDSNEHFLRMLNVDVQHAEDVLGTQFISWLQLETNQRAMDSMQEAIRQPDMTHQYLCSILRKNNQPAIKVSVNIIFRKDIPVGFFECIIIPLEVFQT